MKTSTCCKSELVYITDGDNIKADRRDRNAIIAIKDIEPCIVGKTFYYQCGICNEACDISDRPDFTNEQIDWICYQIGDWYLKNKNTICDYEQKTNNLGRAKEILKIMICGDERNG